MLCSQTFTTAIDLTQLKRQCVHWCRYITMASWNGIIFRIIHPFVRGIHWSPVDSLHKGPVMRSFDVFFDISVCKQLNKQSRGKWIKMSRWSFDVAVMMPETANHMWRHQMETFSALLVLCAGNSPVSSEFPTQRPATRSFDIFFDLCLNKRVSKKSWGWWFETLSCSLWRHCNDRNIF